MEKKIWCPYTNLEVDASATSSEHIVPLSLGGSNSFTIPVDAAFNAQVGGAVDGAIASDFFTLMRRQKLDARGHTGKRPVPVVRRASIGTSSRPAQVTFHEEGIAVWDARLARNLEKHEFTNQRLRLEIQLSTINRLRYLAKVALSGGYFIYGDLFRHHVAHAELRTLMLCETSEKVIASFENSSLRAYYEFAGFEEGDEKQGALDKFICESIPGSCVYTTLTESSIVFIIGVLGQWVGTLNVPADVTLFPLDEDHDLGHAVVLIDKKMHRCSNRQLHREIYEKIVLEDR